MFKDLKMKKALKATLLLFLVSVLSSCGETEDVDDVVSIKRPVHKKVKKESVKEETEEEKRRLLLQNMRAGRNPFKSYITDDEVEDRGPLECCDITQFKVLVLMVGMQGGNKAKILVPSGQKYTVQVGTKIGNRKGTVYKVADGTIYIKEKHKNVLGEEETVRVEISLSSADK